MSQKTLGRGRFVSREEIMIRTREGLRSFATNDRLVFLENMAFVDQAAQSDNISIVESGRPVPVLVPKGAGTGQLRPHRKTTLKAGADQEVQVKNGTVATVLSAVRDRVEVQLDDGRQLAFNPQEYKSIDHGYAMTMHKAQGVTVDRSYVYATRSMDRHMTYVAMTRHRDSAEMFVGREEMANMRSLKKNISRSGLKSSSLDFEEHADQQQQERAFNAAAAKPAKNRVGWSMALNVGRATPEQAWKVMQSTTESAKLLKEANGVRAGKACTKPVYHYSITWPDSDAPSNALQKQAVQESLKVLGMEDHEAIAVQHLDGKPHVHVMVNLIHPETGISASTAVEQANGKKASKLTNSHKRLRKWANQFEKANGLRITETSKLNEERRQKGEKVNARRKNRAVYEREKREGREAMMGWFVNQQTKKGHEIGQAQRSRRENSVLARLGIFERFASARAANDNNALVDFVKASKSLDRREREESTEDRAAWRSYGTGRATEFNSIVQSAEDASQKAEQGQQRGQDQGLGRGVSRGIT